MSPQKSHYVCQSCGYQTPQSWGKCPQCGTWASMVEEVMAPARAKGWERLPGAKEAKLLSQLVQEERVKVQVGIPELDRVDTQTKNQVDELAGKMLLDYGAVITAIPLSQADLERMCFEPFIMNVQKEGILL